MQPPRLHGSQRKTKRCPRLTAPGERHGARAQAALGATRAACAAPRATRIGRARWRRASWLGAHAKQRGGDWAGAHNRRRRATLSLSARGPCVFADRQALRFSVAQVGDGRRFCATATWHGRTVEARYVPRMAAQEDATPIQARPWSLRSRHFITLQYSSHGRRRARPWRGDSCSWCSMRALLGKRVVQPVQPPRQDTS